LWPEFAITEEVIKPAAVIADAAMTAEDETGAE
jgi:hypothetical protein